ncbi:phospholipase A2 inhibitor-like [Oscarella lobularis]|uniref:phospholipase A2 inhibitor-like n=1 Tax=Oscarella lobularis TaxID=121494 RepID=UPI003313FA9E
MITLLQTSEREQCHRPPDRPIAELRVLDLTNNGIKAVRPGTFQKSLSKLESLNISSNGLRVLSEGLFSNLSSLKTLILSVNDLQKVNELHTIFDKAFWDLTNLEDL